MYFCVIFLAIKQMENKKKFMNKISMVNNWQNISIAPSVKSLPKTQHTWGPLRRQDPISCSEIVP